MAHGFSTSIPLEHELTTGFPMGPVVVAASRHGGVYATKRPVLWCGLFVLP